VDRSDFPISPYALYAFALPWFLHRIAAHLNAVSIVNQSVEDCRRPMWDHQSAHASARPAAAQHPPTTGPPGRLAAGEEV
jgi:hypothetical protein